MKKRLLSLLLVALTFSSCKSTPNYYKVTWLNYDGSILEVDENVLELTLPTYDGAIPIKERDHFNEYNFIGWDKKITKVTSDVTYTAVFNPERSLDHLEFSHQSGFYDEAFLLNIEGPKGYDIYYSFDNSDPTTSSNKYVAPLEISDPSNNPNNYAMKQGISSLDVYYPIRLLDKCVLLKVKAINPTTQESTPISYLNYFIGYQEKDGYNTLPIVTLNVNEDDLYDYEKGIYVTGKIYDESPHEGYPETYPANYHQKGKEWEKPANFKYFDKNKNLELDQNIGIRIHGGWSRAFNQKSFNLYARKDYGEHSTFQKQFFDGINAHSLMLRSGGYRDTPATKIRDSLVQDFSMNEGFDIQKSTPVITFLNGEYWGIYNLQERYSDNYIEEHHNIKKKNALIIKNDEIDEGDEKEYHHYEELVEFFKEGNFSSNESYNAAKNYIDMNEFASYMAIQLYVGNSDWPGNNVRVFKDISKDNSKWHFMMFDTDDSMSMLSYKSGPDIDPFLKSSHWKSGPLEDDCLLGLMLSKLIQNDEFKTLFRETFVRVGRDKIAISKVNEYLDNKVALLKTPMVKNYQRFVNDTYDENYFIEKVNTIRSFFQQRYDYAISFLNNHIPE